MPTWIFNHRKQLIPAIVSGLLLTFAFPKVDQGWLAWFALVPFLLVLRKATWRSGFVIGFTCGMVHYLTLVYWTVHTMHMYGHLPWFQSIVIMMLLAAYLSLYPALFGMALPRLCTRPIQLVVVAPITWVALEYMRTWLFTGFPWALLGYTQYDHLWIIQIADITGVYGISTLVMMVNATLAIIALHWLETPWQAHPIASRSVVLGSLATATLILFTLAYGSHRVSQTDAYAEKVEKAKVSVIQGNIDQAVKWDPKFQLLTTVTYRKLSLQAVANDPDLVIWPETATPFYFLHDKNLSNVVIDTVRKAGTYFLIGSPSFTNLPGAYQFHNSAYMLNPDGKSSGRYDKVHLVPFGEYVPLKRWLPFINKLVAQVGDFKPGNAGSTLAWKDHRVGVQICYEVIFPSIARDVVNGGANLLVNITNDAWFGKTSAPYQHYAMAVLRAVENRRWLARAANTGISGFIDPCGRMVEATPLYEETAVTAQVALLDQKSYYTRWGDRPLALLTFAVPLVMIGRLCLHRFKNSGRNRT